ncbi:MAG: Tn3 family transposase [Candidatus Margulisbacteria bacterium]|nr:Tn3 family transposase [Candidatus Margulisiibacteriota bacterium]
MKGKQLLTQSERARYISIPRKIGNYTMATHFTLNPQDLEITNRHRKNSNRIGFAVQLCILRYSGWTLLDIKEIPENILEHIARQVEVEPREFKLYGKRENTKYDHIQEIIREYRYLRFTGKQYRKLLRFLAPYAMKSSNTMYLIDTALERLKSKKIILPAMSTIERAVWVSRNKAEKKIFQILTQPLTLTQKAKLDSLLQGTNGNSKLDWLKKSPGYSSPKTFLKIIEKLEEIRSLELNNIDIKKIPLKRIKYIYRLGASYKTTTFRRFSEQKKYAILVAFLLELSQTLIDQAFEVHDRQINSLNSKGKKKQDLLQKKYSKKINEKLKHYVYFGDAIIEARKEKLDPYSTLESVMSWEKFTKSIQETKELLRPDDGYLDLLPNYYSYLRRYTPRLIKSLEFKATQSSKTIIRALDRIKECNEAGKRKIKDAVPLDFIKKDWEKYIYDEEGNIKRNYYEMATMIELRDKVRSGDISITGSRLHKKFDDYLISKDEWEKVKEPPGLAVSLSADEYLQERYISLNKKLKEFEANINDLDKIDISEDRIHVQRLEKEVPGEVKVLKRKLYNSLPRIKLTDLLIEVASWTEFEKYFIHSSTDKMPHPDEIPVLFATLIAMGTNIGLEKMADATPGISYPQIANVAQWRMEEEAMKTAQTALVNFHHQLDLPLLWGDGTTSSSDGMRVEIGVAALNAQANPHYGNGKGTTFYRFTSDQYSSFYSTIINTNVRDAIHVIDGLLNHETDLEIKEHYTDTLGYTDQVFGLTHLLGFHFAPRLRDLAKSKLFHFGNIKDFPTIKKYFKGKINTKSIIENYDDILRLAYSILKGKVSGTLIMGKLGSYAKQNKIAKALKEMGKIEKTIFLLNYIMDEDFRRRIHRGLNKGEAINALARALLFGKQGILRERSIRNQLQISAALNILINAITIWNTVYLNKAIKELKQRKDFKNLDEGLFKHISPLGWAHINFLGEYTFDFTQKTTLDSLRPLKTKGSYDF